LQSDAMRGLFRRARAAIANQGWTKPLIIIVAAIGVVWTVFLQEATKQLVQNLFSNAPALTYEIVSVDRFLGQQFGEYASREFGGAFSLQLDDSILREYSVFKVRMRNDGGPVEHGFELEAVVNDGSGKIIDVKHAVRAPADKIVPISHDLPNLSWDGTKPGQRASFIWKYPRNMPPAGFFLYRSVYKEFGYGKFNFGPVKRNCISLDRKTILPGYYSVIAVGDTGGVSNFSPPIQYPEALAFQPNFKDLVWVDPLYQPDKDCSPRNAPTYGTLNEAIQKEGSKRIFIVRRSHADAQTPEAPGARLDQEGVRILSEDNLKFLRGKADLKFPEGVDSGTEIDFYFLTKAVSDVNLKLRLRLRGQPKLTFELRAENYGTPRALVPLNVKKVSLTPKAVLTYATETSILIQIPWPEKEGYRGMRIFQTALDIQNPTDALGEEIHDGDGDKGFLSCQPSKGPAQDTAVETPSFYRAPPMEPPKRLQELPPTTPKLGVKTPNAATDLRIILVPGTTPRYFEDNTVRQDVKYKYTIYTYDKTGNYSYPIEVFVSLADKLPEVDCRLVTPQEPSSSLTWTRSSLES
jgi:hypothetical protein